MTTDARICACCGEPTDGPLLPIAPDDPASPLVAEDHEECNRARLMAVIVRAAAASDARLRSRAAGL